MEYKHRDLRVSTATYVADGDIVTDFVPLELVTYAIKEATSLTIVCLMFFPLSRLPISLAIPGIGICLMEF